MAATLTRSLAIKALRETISDYNYWGESESDSPLTVRSSRTPLDERRILSLDASARRSALQTPGYKAPERTIRTESLDEIFVPLAMNSLSELQQSSDAVKAKGSGLETLEKPAEAVEFYVQLYSTFKMLGNPKVYYVEDSSDPYTGLFIIGESSDGETVYAQALLTQT
jgi:hypothetical protein